MRVVISHQRYKGIRVRIAIQEYNGGKYVKANSIYVYETTYKQVWDRIVKALNQHKEMGK